MEKHLHYPAKNRVEFSYKSKVYVAVRNNTGPNAIALKKEVLNP
jgi:hypothetical protein